MLLLASQVKPSVQSAGVTCNMRSMLKRPLEKSFDTSTPKKSRVAMQESSFEDDSKLDPSYSPNRSLNSSVYSDITRYLTLLLLYVHSFLHKYCFYYCATGIYWFLFVSFAAVRMYLLYDISYIIYYDM